MFAWLAMALAPVVISSDAVPGNPGTAISAPRPFATSACSISTFVPSVKEIPLVEADVLLLGPELHLVSAGTAVQKTLDVAVDQSPESHLHYILTQGCQTTGLISFCLLW